MNQKKYIYISAVIILALLVVFSFSRLNQKAEASASDNLSNWTWSENIGWISFNSTNCDSDDNGQSNGTPAGCPPAGTTMAHYGVNVVADGTMSGYAWSENIGWIKFDNVADGSHPQAKFDRTAGAVTGWARACAGTINGDCTGGSRTDGWDGWIHLSN